MKLLFRPVTSIHRITLPSKLPYHARFNSTKTCDPLRILFCGTDDFSAASLKALHQEQTERPDSIESIEVVCRPPKRYGRGLMGMKELAIKPVAKDLGLHVHELDTFRDWRPPNPINLIIAVSFGLLIPPRIQNFAKYGGLNLHPSLLPDLRGPAPLHHTLLRRRQTTGISLQTLHPTQFDRGQIIAQTPYPGFPVPPSCTYEELHDLVTRQAISLLVQSLRDKLFVSPLKEVGWALDPELQAQRPEIVYAPKISKADCHILWSEWSADEILRRQSLLGNMWNFAAVREWRTGLPKEWESKRIIIQLDRAEDVTGVPDAVAGEPFIWDLRGAKGKEVLFVWTEDRVLLRITALKVEGRAWEESVVGAVKAGMVDMRIDNLRKGKRFHRVMW